MAGINSALFKAWTKKAVDNEFIKKTLNGFVVKESYDGVFSEVNKNAPAVIKPIILEGVLRLAQLQNKRNSDEDFGGIGVANDALVIEVPIKDKREIAIIKDSKIYIAKCEKSQILPYVFKEGHDNGVMLITAILLAEISGGTFSSKNNELINNYSKVKIILGNSIDENNVEDFGKTVAVVCENLYRRIIKENILVHPFNDLGNTFKITETMIKGREYVPTKDHVVGKLEVFTEEFFAATETQSNEKIEGEIQSFTNNRNFTEEEKKLIPEIEPWYIMPKEVLEICSLISKTSESFHPKRNFMLRGPSSTGKTSMARAIAAKLGLPYVYITCSADTESSAFLGEPMYDENGAVKYIESPFVRAIRNGWVVEVQEPYVIQKQGVLTSLNGLLDDGNGVTLATGEFIKRHPDAIVIFTTNVSYVGCKKPNQSVLRRMNNVYDVVLPSEAEILKRVESNTGFKNRSLLSKMVKCISKINAYLQEEMIDDGVCGISELIDWVSTMQVTHDIIGSANSTVVSKATDSLDDQTSIAGIIESYLSNDVYAE